jgi:K+-sensing histidine kinase KdpD
VNQDRLLGGLNINDKKDGSPFSEDEFELLKIIANHAAMAIENAFLMTRLKTKAAELEEMNKKLIETDILKTKFLTRISHELRTPLNSIRGAIYFLQQSENVLKKERGEFQDIISAEADKLTAIIEDLLTFLRSKTKHVFLTKRFSVWGTFSESCRALHRSGTFSPVKGSVSKPRHTTAYRISSPTR